MNNCNCTICAPYLKKHMPSGQNSFFAQTGKENTRMRMKIVIYFVNDEKVMQKQGVLNFDHKDQLSINRRPPVTNNQRITYICILTKKTDRGHPNNKRNELNCRF